jgi:phosphoesterase RecJ-like protein
MIEDVAKTLTDGRRFLVTCHLSPDGDAIGSMLAVVHLLRANGREGVAFHSEPVPGPYRFLAGAGDVVSDPAAVGPFDTLVVVDVGERDRIPEDLPAGADTATVVVIDHHQHHGGYGHRVWRRKASAVGEMVVELARHLGWVITLEFAECAYTAILTDTGSFRYSSTTAACLETAAFLVSLGVQPWKVASNVYESWPSSRLLLLGDVLSTLEVSCEGRFASTFVSLDMLDDRRASVDMTEGFVNEGRRIEGVEVSALFREQSPGCYRISFRSRGRVDVATIASALGGGGHRNASGAMASGTLAEIRDRVTRLVAEALEALDPDDEDCWSRH